MMGPTDLLGPMLQGQNEAQAEKMYSGRTRIVPAKLDLLSRALTGTCLRTQSVVDADRGKFHES